MGKFSNSDLTFYIICIAALFNRFTFIQEEKIDFQLSDDRQGSSKEKGGGLMTR